MLGEASQDSFGVRILDVTDPANPRSLGQCECAGLLLAVSGDHLYVAPDSPTIMSVVDLTQGGRLYIQMTDVDPEDVRVGDEVVLTLRRRKEGPTMHHYYWKCRPVR